MSKYYLVGSYYNVHNGTYKNEIVLKEINGCKLSSLAKIDEFTSKYSNSEIFRMISKEMEIDYLNHLAVKYMKNNSSSPVYYRIIGENKLYNDCVENLEEHKVTILGKTRDTLLVKRNSELYKQELAKLLELIDRRDFEKFKEFYSINNDLSFLVKRYLATEYDNDLDKEKDLELILLEFSRYKTFRGWFIETRKNKTSSVKNAVNINRRREPEQKVKVATFDENMALFDKNFVEKHNMTYDQYRTLEHNRGDNYVFDDGEDVKEEFLDAKEFNDMVGYDEDVIREELNGRFLKKKGR